MQHALLPRQSFHSPPQHSSSAAWAIGLRCRRCLRQALQHYRRHASIADDQINHTGHTYNNRNRTINGGITRNVDRSRTRNVDKDVTKNVDRSTTNIDRRRIDRSTTINSDFDYTEITNEAVQHAPVPSAPGPAAPDSVAVFTIYGQVDQAGPVAGFSLSMPLN